jgi:hypothetical protein
MDISAERDMNVSAERDMNVSAERDMNVSAEGDMDDNGRRQPRQKHLTRQAASAPTRVA